MFVDAMPQVVKKYLKILGVRTFDQKSFGNFQILFLTILTRRMSLYLSLQILFTESLL